MWKNNGDQDARLPAPANGGPDTLPRSAPGRLSVHELRSSAGFTLASQGAQCPSRSLETRGHRDFRTPGGGSIRTCRLSGVEYRIRRDRVQYRGSLSSELTACASVPSRIFAAGRKISQVTARIKPGVVKLVPGISSRVASRTYSQPPSSLARDATGSSDLRGAKRADSGAEFRRASADGRRGRPRPYVRGRRGSIPDLSRTKWSSVPEEIGPNGGSCRGRFGPAESAHRQRTLASDPR